ncbi:MAG: PqiC family protein [Psychrobium sp.]
MKRIVISLAMLALAGCQSVSQSVNIFQLSGGPNTAQVDFNATQLLVKRVALVDYLKQSSIVFEGEGGELIATRYQIWAEPVDKGISRSLINDINQSQTAIRADDQYFARCRPQSSCYSVELYVEKFYPSYDSSVKFAGKYRLFRDDTLLAQHDFNLTKDLSDDGYGHAVDSLDDLVAQLGKSIVEQVSQLP